MVVGERPEGGLTASALAEVRALGTFAVTVAGRSLSHADWQRLSAERLFKLLLVTPGHRLGREIAAETLWPDSSPETGRANLRKAIHFAHRALLGSDVLGGDTRTVALDPAGLDLDLDRLSRALDVLRDARRSAAAEAHSGEGAPSPAQTVDRQVRPSPGQSAVADALETVLDLGPRELLPDDQYEDWLVGPRERLRSQWQRVAILVAREARTAGRSAQAHEIVDQLLERDPMDEGAHRVAIELYASEGRHHAARRQFELCRTALREGLDTEPAPETVAAYESAERGAGAEHGAGTERRAGSTVGLVARRGELGRIEELFDRVGDGRLACLVIRGPAGIGKTRLLEEVAAYGHSAGWRVIGWQAVDALRVEAFAPLRIALAGRLTPEDVAAWHEPARSGVATLVPGLLADRLEFQDRGALVSALVAALVEFARSCPIVISIDDLPWLDDSSLTLLAALVAGGAGSPILIAGTYRDDEPAPDALRGLVDAMRRSGGMELRLGPLARRDVDPLVLGHLGGEAVEPELGQSVFEQSRGIPLFCLEIMRAGTEHGVIRQVGGRWELAAHATLRELPDSARRIASRRSASLPASARELLAVAAELGPRISFEVLSAALPGGTTAIVDALDAALASGLLVEADGGYAFAHPLYRLAVRRAAGPARRGASQFDIARALAGPVVADDDPEALAAGARTCAEPLAVAEHALTAADLGVTRAMPLGVAFGFAAGDRLFALHDSAGAAAVLERAVAAWRRLAPADAHRFAASGAFVNLGRIRSGGDDEAAATALFREAIDAARDVDELAIAYDAFWEWVPYRRGDFERARAIVNEALARLPESAVVQRAHMQGLLGWTLVRLRRPADALPLLEEAARGLGPSMGALGAIRVLDPLGMTLHYLGRTEEGRAYVERSLAISLEQRSTTGEILGNLHVAVLLARGGQHARARPMFARAAELGRLTGNRYIEAMAAWGGAESADELGDYAAAREARRREIELLESIGGNPHNAAMSHAHLANLAARSGDDEEAAREAAEARRLAPLSPEAGYPERIERAIAIERWAELDT